MHDRSYLSRICKLWANVARGLLAAAVLFVGLAPAARWGSDVLGASMAGMVYYVDTNHPQASDGKLHFSPTGALTSYQNALFSPDGAQMVTTDQGVIHLWDMRDGALLQSLEALPPALFSPDGAMLITSGEGVVGFWQVSDGILLRYMEAATLPAAFSSDGRTLISMRDGVVETWGVPAP
jgi:WD40 repeat protein